jgi:hypothetical protein
VTRVTRVTPCHSCDFDSFRENDALRVAS